MKINKKATRDWLFYWIAVGGGAFILFFLVTSTLIGHDAKENCKIAQAKYGGDCTEALSAFLDDDSNPIGERNHAIWALGQFGDPAALPVLEKYYTGEIPDHEPWEGVISQYELKKAIKLASGGFNITHLVW
jgi:hypothetical protein